MGLALLTVKRCARSYFLIKYVYHNITSEVCGTCVLDTIAFHTVLTSYETIPTGSAVLFNEVLLNEGDG